MREWPALAFAADAPAVVHEGGTLSFRALRARVWSRARELAEEARGPALLHGPNTLELVVELLALQEAERVPVLVNPRVPKASAEAWFAEVARDLEALGPPPEPLADVVFTSGSTGRPKAVAHGLSAHQRSAEGANERVPFGEGDRWLLSLSLCHVGGLGVLERALSSGGAVALPAPGAPLAASVLDLQASHVSLVRTQLSDLLVSDEGRRALARCRTALVGGGPCPRELFAKALEAGAQVRQTWGLTETTAQVTTSEAGAPFTAGRPLRHHEVRRRADGRLVVRGPALAAGYLTPEGLSLPLDEEGFFVTSDLGHFDEDGNVIIQGRADLVFISGGENLHPEEIEAALLGAPGVLDAVVVPVAHPRWGQRPVAFVVTAGPLEAHALRAALEAKLPRYALPDAFYPWPKDEPRQKPSRPRLAARAEALSRRG